MTIEEIRRESNMEGKSVVEAEIDIGKEKGDEWLKIDN